MFLSIFKGTFTRSISFPSHITFIQTYFCTFFGCPVKYNKLYLSCYQLSGYEWKCLNSKASFFHDLQPVYRTKLLMIGVIVWVALWLTGPEIVPKEKVTRSVTGTTVRESHKMMWVWCSETCFPPEAQKAPCSQFSNHTKHLVTMENISFESLLIMI